MPASEFDWQVDDAPSPAHRQWCERERLLFAHTDWAGPVRALDLDLRFAWNAQLGVGLLLPLRRALGLRGGVFGFPVTPFPLQALPPETIVRHADAIVRAAGLDLLRVNYSWPELPRHGATAWRPEVWLDDLPTWSLADHKRLRKDLAAARRSELGLRVEAAAAADAPALFALYAATVQQHGGRLNYTPAYFSALIALSARSDRLRVHCARGSAGGLHGFAVSGADGAVGYYLHGGTDAAGKRGGAADLLLEQVVLHAQSGGCRLLTFMSSPWDQPGLVRFKRKWGNRIGFTVTLDRAGGMAGAAARLLTRWRSRADRRSTVLPAD